MTTVWVWLMTCELCGRAAWVDLGGRGWGPHVRIDSCAHVVQDIERYIASTPQVRAWQRRRSGAAGTGYHVMEVSR